jgi:hypothetical protein
MDWQHVKEGLYSKEYSDGWHAVVRLSRKNKYARCYDASIENRSSQQFTSDQLLWSLAQAFQWCDSCFVDRQIENNISISEKQATCKICGASVTVKH